MTELYVVKREGHAQTYDEKKVYASVFASALNAHLEDQQAEAIAQKATNEINSWMKFHPTVKAHKIKLEITDVLKKFDKDVALMYEHHMDIN